MAPVKIKHVVSFTSQDPKNCVENLCDVNGDNRPWLCNPLDRSGVLKVELQMERASTIRYIDVGNCGSAFIQVDVGRSSWSLEHPYVTLLPTATLMSPADSRQGSGRHGVRMFKKADFLSEVAEESWDVLRVTCSQPFNKRSQFGLSFLRIRSSLEGEEGASADHEGTENQTTPDKPRTVKEWLSSPAVQRTFFGREDSPDDAQQNPRSLSRAERMVLTAAQSGRRSLPLSPRCASTQKPKDAKLPNPPPEAGPSGLTPPSSTANTSNKQLKRKSNSKARQVDINGATPCKKPTPASHMSPAPKQSSVIVLPEPPVMQDPTCPLCGVTFDLDYLPLHASSCQGEDAVQFLGVIETRFTTSPSSPAGLRSSPDEPLVPCPLCSFSFPLSHIQQHASTCEDSKEPHCIWVD